jgi:arsenite methyltransferase
MTSDLKQVVKQKYGQASIRVWSAAQKSCCETPGCQAKGEPVTPSFYDDLDQRLIPDEALLASLGCGNPTAVAELKSGETVLDPGSGGGIVVLLSARRVGPNGKAYGLDMTDEMLALARHNQPRAGFTNVEFLKGAFPCPPTPSTSSSPIASSTSQPIKSASSARTFARSSPAAAPQFPTWWRAARCPLRCARACCSGWVASRAP